MGVFTGIFAKEAVVGTLDALCATMDAEGSGTEEAADFDFRGAVVEAFGSIPANLAGLGAASKDPLGLSVGNVDDAGLAAEEQEVSVGTFGSMVTLFGTQAAAFAYLLFILLYFPCSAAIAAVYRETNLRWAAFAGFWTTFMAYFATTVFNQAATFSSHPASSAVWLLSMATILATVIAIMKILGRNGRPLLAHTAGARA